jgi:hypothetical protein
MAEKLNEKEVQEFTELKAIVQTDGFMKLDTKEKRDRYRELKEKYDKEFEKVEITKADLQTLLDEAVQRYKQEALKEYKDSGMEEVKKFGQWMKAKQHKEENRRAKLRLYREEGTAEPGLVIDLKFKKNGFNEATRKHDDPIYELSVLYSTGEQKEDIRQVEMRLLDFVQINEFEEVEILDKEETPQVLIQGQGRAAYTNSGYSFSAPSMFGTKPQKESGEVFDYIVSRTDMIYRVKRPNGDILRLHSSKLNQ